MENTDSNTLLSMTIKAGKRTYFFDVKETKAGDKYLTITESKKKSSPDGLFTFEKHKLFLYREEFDKFATALSAAIDFAKTGNKIESDTFDKDEFLENFLI